MSGIYTLVSSAALFLFILVSGGCNTKKTIWQYDEEGAETIAEANHPSIKFTEQIDEIRVYVNTIKRENDFCHIENPDEIIAKKPDYRFINKESIRKIVPIFSYDNTYDNQKPVCSSKMGDRFCIVLFIESEKKQIIRFQVAMPKGRSGAFVEIFPLWKTDSIYGSARVSRWLGELLRD